MSDGGEENRLEYYEWVIATNDKILVKHKGQAAENHKLIKSLRTESEEVPLLVYYIYRLCEFYEIT